MYLQIELSIANTKKNNYKKERCFQGIVDLDLNELLGDVDQKSNMIALVAKRMFYGMNIKLEENEQIERDIKS